MHDLAERQIEGQTETHAMRPSGREERCPVCARVVGRGAVVRGWKWYCSPECAAAATHVPGLFLG